MDGLTSEQAASAMGFSIAMAAQGKCDVRAVDGNTRYPNRQAVN